ncbi:hypothetical protein C8Q80DRAFT_766769 [Daedaleopsis nitida]|nr:hypothetical protein C8Q80DRAFT_766769 [Daedaleopsis nitida]
MSLTRAPRLERNHHGLPAHVLIFAPTLGFAIVYEFENAQVPGRRNDITRHARETSPPPPRAYAMQAHTKYEVRPALYSATTLK